MNNLALQRKPTLRQFVLYRLGNPNGPWSALRRMLVYSFGARSFASFWHYWNPVYHYFLYYRVYQPLHAFLPRPVAILLTFAFCGFFLHDLALIFITGVPLITLSFFFLGVGVIAGELFSMDLSRQPYAIRLTANTVYLVSSFEIARRVALLLF
jgi:hypothetical protein